MQRSGTEAIRTQLHPSKPKMIYPCNVIINCTLCLHCIGYCRIVIKLADMKEKSMQISGTESIRTQLQPSKLKRKKTKTTNSQNTKRTYGQPSEQLFPKRWPLSNQNRAKNNMETHKAKRHRNSDTKTGNREPQ